MTISNKIIDGLVLIVLNISLWQGRKKLRVEDLEEKGISTSSLPPEKLASLGSKRVVSPDAVNVFMALKRRAERACIAVGTRFLGGYAIPEDKLPALHTELEAVEKEFEIEKIKLLSQYETTVEAWAAENPEWRDAILRAVDNPFYVAEQLQCNHVAMKFGHAPGAEKTLDKQASGLRGQLEREIALAAKTAWEESFQGKLSVRKSALGKLALIADKLEGLSFLDGQIAALATSVKSVLQQVDNKQFIEGTDLLAVCGILATLMGLDRIRFSYEADAALTAIMPVPESPVEETQPVPEPEAQVAATPQPKPKAKIAPVVTQPTKPITEESHFTDLVSDQSSVPVPQKHIVRMEEITMEYDGDLPFGGGEAIMPIIDTPTGGGHTITEWF